jgi:hypothetical protein
MKKEFYTHDEVQKIINDIINDIINKAIVDTANHCAEYCDTRKGYLDIGGDIRKHYKIEEPIDKPKHTKPTLRLVK